MTLDALIDRRSEPEARAVLEDLRLSHGERPLRLGVMLWLANADAADDAAAAAAAAAADDAAAAAAAADADAAAADDAAAAASAAAADDAADADAAAAADDAAAAAAAAAADDAAAADAADAADDAADAAADICSLHQSLKEQIDMRNGLKIIVFVPGRYGYGLSRVGWVRRVSGDEYELLSARTLFRKRGSYEMGGLNKLAAEGLSEDYGVTDVDKTPEELNRLLVRRVIVADEKAWAKLCPRPKGWAE